MTVLCDEMEEAMHDGNSTGTSSDGELRAAQPVDATTAKSPISRFVRIYCPSPSNVVHNLRADLARTVRKHGP
jgi:hypothetical protein